METPVEGERNDVRVELIEAEPAEFIPPEYRFSPAGLSGSLLIEIISSGALYSRIGRSDKLDNGVVFCLYKGPSCHANNLTFSHRIAVSSQVHLSPTNPLSFSQVRSLPAAASFSLPAAFPDEPARERDVIPEPSHHHTKMSDNIRSPAEDSVYRLFERALENNNLHSLWVGLDRVVPREVFRWLGLREPFPRPTSAPTKPKTTPTARFAPYARPADKNLKFLNEKERAELEAVQKVKKEHTLAILIAQRKEKEAAETALYLQQTCLLRREKETLEQREVELAKSSAARRLAAKTPEPYIPSPIVRPAVLQIQALPDIPSQPEPSTSAPDAQLVTPARSSKSAKSSKSRSSSTRSRKEAPGETPRSSKEGRGRTSSSEMVLAKKFKKPSINTSDDEEAVLKSPTSPYST
ncbi:hypothetical protein OUZ56_016938 [Daphnia magna]|uniref:Uncharacterized protein n=1 Tax=Daphnia magna TaxID=35525 RepID=A0ABR0ARQ7_9CRUS|nr:hypothetical protein OUZ56_016938 [Daphnia magna]